MKTTISQILKNGLGLAALVIILSGLSGAALAAPLKVVKVTSGLKDPATLLSGDAWKNAPPESVTLMGQPMVAPRPKKTETSMVKVQAIHDGDWIAFRLSWKDPEYSEAGKVGLFSDAVALQFPVKSNTTPPPVFMGGKDNPVHLFHWRAQYQYDKEKGMKSMKDIYPNMNVDMYPMEFKDAGSVKDLNEAKQEVYSHGKAAGNPQSYRKRGIDEILAEGFSTSAVIEETESEAHGSWKNGEWTVVISRALTREGGSVLKAGEGSFVGFAVWQGGKDEVGSRKSVTMSWTPIQIEK